MFEEKKDRDAVGEDELIKKRLGILILWFASFVTSPSCNNL